jgi:hypothetical protein
MAKQYSTSLFKEKDLFARILTIIIVIVVLIIAWQIYKSVKQGGEALATAAQDTITASATGLPEWLVTLCRTEGQRLWDEGVTNYLLTKDYDEDMFISVITDIGDKAGSNYAKALTLLNQAYKKASGQTIGYVVKISFDSNDRSVVDAKYLAALS